MAKVLIKGIDKQGPGDIVGAVAGETGVNPKHLGNIEIKNSLATVEVEDDQADKLARQLDGKNVGSAKVSVASIAGGIDEKIETIDSYVDKYRSLVELERQQEMQEHEESIRNLSGEQRQAEGKAILHLRGRDEGTGLEGRLIKFMRQKKGESLPETEITVGDLVMLSRKDPLRDDNPTGTVVQKTNYAITAAFELPPEFIMGKGLRMDLYVNDITYRRMKDALGKLRDAKGRLAQLRDILIGYDTPTEREKESIETWFNEKLNESQKNAVAHAMAAEEFHLIHGPPGTGKTTTIIEVIEQAAEEGREVLATAASNTAVDNMLEFLVQRGVKAVRVGHPARVTPQLKEHTLDKLVGQTKKYRESEELRDKAFAKKEEQEEQTHPSGKYRRGMSNEKIQKLAEKEEGSRGVSPDKVEEMAEWLSLQEEANRLFEKADKLKEEAVGEVIDNHKVVCTTNSTAGSELMEGRTFELAVIDEATQATEPSCLIPLTHGNKVVMAGDHKQLPPTIKNLEAAHGGLENTMFERLAESFPEIKSLLTIQYRMHEDIMNFSNEAFYQGSLVAHESVKEHTLSDMDMDLDTDMYEGEIAEILDPDEPVVFVDTAGLESPERTRSGSSSKENPKEAELVKQLAGNLLRSGMLSSDIAIISPYNDQVDLLNRIMAPEEIEINSVDGFQGREKEAVILSLTRSNPEEDIGFLKDIRRLNVALTRAKRKLIVIGDRSTIGTHNMYQRFMNYAEQNGKAVAPEA